MGEAGGAARSTQERTAGLGGGGCDWGPTGGWQGEEPGYAQGD